jgi:tripartite-type tricarboxylate transporter receptor subunit TctC
MKRQLASLLFLFVSTLSFAQANSIPVPIVWPFSVGSNQVNFIRVIIEDANKKQNKYNFYVEFKPGAGGTIAAQYVENHKNIALLSSSSSFFVRSFYYPNESHKVENFKPVLIECTGQPMAVVSKNFSSINELKNQKRLTIGANFGSLTEAVVRQLQQVLPGVEIDIIPFPGTVQATQEVLAGRLDLNVDTPGESLQWLEVNKINMIGSSGTVENKYFKTFNSQGIKGFSGLTNNYMMVASSKTDPEIVKELHEILRASAQTTAVRLREYYARDYCVEADLNFKQTNDIFNKWSNYWPEKLNSLSKGK